METEQERIFLMDSQHIKAMEGFVSSRAYLMMSDLIAIWNVFVAFDLGWICWQTYKRVEMNPVGVVSDTELEALNLNEILKLKLLALTAENLRKQT